MMHSLLSRSSTRDAGAATTRLEVCPPSLRPRHPVQLAVAWLRSVWAPLSEPVDRAGRRDPRLDNVKREFMAELSDIRTVEAGAMKSTIWAARSLRELWHLRAPLFGLVSRHHDQQEAGLRLARLNRHFPTRSPRSGLAPLDRLGGPQTPAR